MILTLGMVAESSSAGAPCMCSVLTAIRGHRRSVPVLRDRNDPGMGMSLCRLDICANKAVAGANAVPAMEWGVLE